jgi:uncharacterized membrane protein YeaQ/YmgE (transglycosylase-associated protein family)
VFIILGIIVFGMAIGGIAQLIVGGKNMWNIDWGVALAAGLVGSFVGGFLGSLIFEQDFDLHPSGFIGSLIGAVIVTFAWTWFEKKSSKSSTSS